MTYIQEKWLLNKEDLRAINLCSVCWYADDKQMREHVTEGLHNLLENSIFEQSTHEPQVWS